jgi:cadmium resistance protein CadD (predicted permease)
MKDMFHACWRALLDALRLRVLLLTLAPLAVMLLLTLGLGFWFGDAALDWARGWVDGAGWLNWTIGLLDAATAAQVRAVLAPLLLIALCTPLVVVGALLLVAVFMMPTMRRLVAQTRFAALERRGGGARAWLGSLVHSLGVTLVALVLLFLSMPLWLIPPLIVILPPLIFGWLGYRVMSYDALSEHAAPAERRALMQRHRAPLLALGVITGYLGAAPVAVWAPGLLLLSFVWLVVPVAIWIYTWMFAFSSLWFAHYCLNALQEQRRQEAGAINAEASAAPPHAFSQELADAR